MTRWPNTTCRSLAFAILVTALCVAAGFCIIKSTSPVLADSEGLGSLRGVVRNQAGVPVNEILLTLTSNSVAGSIHQTIVTDGAGRYTFGTLPAGLYYIKLEDRADRYPSPQYYDNAIGTDGATPITVAGEDITNFDLTIYPGGELHGRVTDADGRPLANVQANAYQRDSSSSPIRQGVTDSAGRYVITGLAADIYVIEFIDLDQLHYAQFYSGASSFYNAELVGVSANGRVENLDARLQEGSTIRGQVTNSSGAPLAGILVQASRGYYSERSVLSDENGNYTLGALEAGGYRVAFRDPAERYEAQSYFNAIFDDRIYIGEQEDVTGINVVLTRRGAVEGKVTDEAGNPLANARVRAISRLGNSATRTTNTDEQGEYHLDGLSLVEYGIEFSKPESFYLREYYNNVATLDASIPLTVAPGETLTNVNASLAIGGAITGVVTHVDQALLGFVRISAFPQSSPMTATHSAITTVLSSRYTYTLGGLPAEPYFVKVEARGQAEYHDNTTAQERATLVPVTTGQVTPNVNFVLGDRADAATLSGTVRSAAGNPLGNVNVALYCLAPCGSQESEPVIVELPFSTAGTEPTWNYLRSTRTDANGTYQFSGVDPRRYRLRFMPSTSTGGNHAFQYYDAAVDLMSATEIDLQPFMVRGDVNATLTAGGTLTGVVTIGDGYPVRETRLHLYFWDGYQWTYLTDRAAGYLTGAYAHSGLQTGRYRVAASGSIGGERYHYFYGNTTVLTAATDINVTAGLTVPNVNINLAADAFLNAAITGTVTADGQPLPNIRVELYDTRSNLVRVTTTDRAGRYVADQLATRSYIPVFVDPTATYAIGYVETITTFSTASIRQIYVNANQIITNVNTELVPGSAIQGRVTDIAGNGLKDVQIQISTFVSDSWKSATPIIRTDGEGFYRSPALRPGHYVLYFDDPFGRYRARYYGNSAIREQSPRIEVRVGESVTGVDVVMSKELPHSSYIYLPVVAR